MYFQVLGKNLETMVRCGNWAAAHCIKVIFWFSNSFKMHHFTAERLHDARHLRLPSLSSSFASLAVKEPVLRIVCNCRERPESLSEVQTSTKYEHRSGLWFTHSFELYFCNRRVTCCWSALFSYVNILCDLLREIEMNCLVKTFQ